MSSLTIDLGPMMESIEKRLVYLLVDGENIDRTLGQILGKKPQPDQRPRWDRIKKFIENKFDANCRALFFLNATDTLPGSFIQALKVAGFIPIPLSGPSDVKIVDEGIIRTLEAIKKQPVAQREGDRPPGIILISHDADFVSPLIDVSDRPTAVICFTEYLSNGYSEIPGLQIYDIEEDVNAFNSSSGPLPRDRTIDIKDFDPERYLS